MYTEEYEKRGFPIRNFIIKLILVIILIFLLIWLLPKLIGPVINRNKNNSESNSNNGKSCVTETCSKGISALTSQIFLDNMNKMKEAAITYYTEDRLPKEVGKSETMTLSDMIGKKLIIALIDKNNKAVDVEKSYVKITKLDDEYLLKVNLKDSEKEDYILVHLGCYSYCSSYVCQKNGSDKAKGSVVGEYVPIKGSKDSGIYYIPDTPTPVVDKHYCVYYGGNYYDTNGNIVSKAQYIKSCTTPSEDKHYCVYYNGKYYDKNGNVVSKDEYTKSCSTTPEDKHFCVYYNGKYYDKDGKVVSKEEYKKSCVPEEDKHYCTYYDGKYYDKNGNVVSEAEYKTSCGIPEEDDDYVYEYKKVYNAKLSEWTKWSAWDKTNCATAELNCSDNDITCLKKIQILKRKEEIGTYEKTYAKTRDMLVQTGSYKQKTCSKYNYVIINNVTYATTTTTTYTQVNTITTTTSTYVGGWVYNGRGSYSNPPSDSAGNHYVFVGADYSYCGATCQTLPNYYYDSYTYTGGLTNVSTTVTPGPITSTTETETTTTTEQVGTEASCGEIVEKTVPIYKTITVTEKAKRTEPLYGDVCYSSSKTRKVISEGQTKYKWSNFNDTALLEAGWVYTGNKKPKSQGA